MANVRKKKTRQIDKRKIVLYVGIILIILFTIWYEHHSAQQEPYSSAQDSSSVEIQNESTATTIATTNVTTKTSTAKTTKRTTKTSTAITTKTTTTKPTTEQTTEVTEHAVQQTTGQTTKPAQVIPKGEVLKLHMIDCGQGDAFLFEQNEKYGLIDCGTRSTGKDVVNYLQKHGITELQFIVGTHPHDDHMGGMEKVVDTIKCNQIYMPKIEKGQVTTNWYMSLINKIKTKKIKLSNPSVNDSFSLENTTFKVVGQFTPSEAKQNLNNYSTVIKVTFGQMDIMMTGDAEVPVEKQILSSNSSNNLLDCEILKLGHHGSTTSTSSEFFKAVSPDYVLVSCGIGNKYNHPCKETLDKVEESKIPIYRTDENGDVIVAIYQNKIVFDEKPGDYVDGPELAKRKGVS